MSSRRTGISRSAELRRIGRHESSIIEAAIPPVAAMLLAAFGLISTKAAGWIAYGLGLAVLMASGLVFARVERLGWVATLVVVALNVALGSRARRVEAVRQPLTRLRG